MDLHKIELKPKHEPQKGHFTTGANSQVLLDGQLLKGVTSCTIKVDAGGIAKVTIEMVGHIEANIIGELETQILAVKMPEGN